MLVESSNSIDGFPESSTLTALISAGHLFWLLTSASQPCLFEHLASFERGVAYHQISLLDSFTSASAKPTRRIYPFGWLLRYSSRMESISHPTGGHAVRLQAKNDKGASF